MGPYVGEGGPLKNEHFPKVVLNKDSKVKKPINHIYFNLQVNNALFTPPPKKKIPIILHTCNRNEYFLKKRPKKKY
jgi:hypothetical protein